MMNPLEVLRYRLLVLLEEDHEVFQILEMVAMQRDRLLAGLNKRIQEHAALEQDHALLKDRYALQEHHMKRMQHINKTLTDELRHLKKDGS